MSAPPTVNVIGPSHGYGLALDCRIIGDLLRRAGFDVAQVDYFFPNVNLMDRIRCRWARDRLRFSHRLLGNRFPRRDINIFVERIPPEMFPAARHQVLIPNQEWFPVASRDYLKKFDLVVCKTRHAEGIFSQLGCRTAFSSFTSRDRRLSPPVPKRREFLLVTGSLRNVADRVIGFWARHPEWPQLTVSGRFISPGPELPNVRVIRNFIPEEEMVHLQNTHLFHLLVTAAEGFGHKHNEAFSCGAIVVATDGPPMNEIVQPDRGLLVKWNRSNPKNMGMEYHFDEADLERTVERCLRLPPGEIDRLATQARAWFEKNDFFFKERFPAILRQVLVAA